ncbi:MAG: helix-turn-helix transcriptional regulator [Deltaproteobacteria bacterium]|nr:helix-turn-helix transcriptional regulator [Deltaproteobacteria bacterium]
MTGPSLGAKLRDLRLAKHLTLQQVAERASYTAGYVSQIEHDKASPSIASLKKIAAALDARIVDLFLDEADNDSVVLEPSQWVTVSLARWKADIRQMVRSVKHHRMQPFYTVIQPGGGTSEDYSHHGEEFGLVLDGDLTLKVGSETYQVKKGSSFYYSSNVPHAWTNEADVPCTVVWVVTPPSW